MALYPLILDPAYKDYIWGGDRIPALFDRPLPPGTYAESWELSDRPEGMSHITNGTWKGASLSELVTRFGPELIGRGVSSANFPLLVKLIDARERLSIQVHPDDALAAKGLGEAKTEAWHILHAPPDAKVFAGLTPNATATTFLAALKENRLESCLQAVPVKTGDTIFIPGGRLHAICEGLVLLEVQQSSNTTYRVYDWGRVGKDGKARDLHLGRRYRSSDGVTTFRSRPFPKLQHSLPPAWLWNWFPVLISAWNAWNSPAHSPFSTTAQAFTPYSSMPAHWKFNPIREPCSFRVDVLA